MRQIRRNVFETNSSSTHSICITNNMLLDQLKTHVNFKFRDFGWENSLYQSTEDKASYLYTALYNNDENDLILMIADTLRRQGITYEFEKPPSDDDYDFWIDHAYELKGSFNDICRNEEKLMRYLFSSESFIITGNDNDDEDVDIHVTYPHEEIYKGN